jgi:hypothetical protein
VEKAVWTSELEEDRPELDEDCVVTHSSYRAMDPAIGRPFQCTGWGGIDEVRRCVGTVRV